MLEVLRYIGVEFIIIDAESKTDQISAVKTQDMGSLLAISCPSVVFWLGFWC